MKAYEQLDKALQLGIEAFKRGDRAIPAHDPALLQMLAGKPQEGEATTNQIVDEWTRGWNCAQASATSI